jgi:hypothetical protein
VRRMLVFLLAVALAAASSAGSATARQQQGSVKVPVVTYKIHSKSLVEYTVRGSGAGWRMALGAKLVGRDKRIAPIKVVPRVEGKMDYGNYEMVLPRLNPGKPLVLRFYYSPSATRNGVCYGAKILYKTNPPIVGNCIFK